MSEPLAKSELKALRDRLDVWSDYGPDPTETIERLLATVEAREVLLEDALALLTRFGATHSAHAIRDALEGKPGVLTRNA